MRWRLLRLRWLLVYDLPRWWRHRRIRAILRKHGAEHLWPWWNR